MTLKARHTADLDRLLYEFYTPELKGIRLGLERVKHCLAALENPERRLPPVVHVAGTNGKGSVVAYLKAISKAAGLRAHVYTSPDLVRFNERIVLNHDMISDEVLIDVLQRVQAIAPDHPLTFFEGTCIAGLLAFAEHPADLLLLEVGMGGRLDATNVVEKPLLSVIMPISLDHQQFLGATIEEIASEKAGILKSGVPCVVAKQDASALSVIEEKAAAIGAPLYREGKEWRVEQLSDGFIYRSARGEKRLPLPSLAGAHQIYNAAAAIACAEMMEVMRFSDTQLAAGIASAVWPARLQLLQRGPLVERLPGVEVRLDGGHNPAAGDIIADWLKPQKASGRAIHLICGMVNTKDPARFLSPMTSSIDSLIAVAIPKEEASHPARAVAAAARSLGIMSEEAGSLEDAYARMEAVAGPGALVLVCGSLYLAGEVLKTHA